MDRYDFEYLDNPSVIREIQWDMDAVQAVCDKYSAEIFAYSPEDFIDDKDVQLGIIGRLSIIMRIEQFVRYSDLLHKDEMIKYLLNEYERLEEYIRPIRQSGPITPLYATMREHNCTSKEARAILREAHLKKRRGM